MNYIHLQLMPSQVNLILKALELYAFNFHNTWGVDIDSEENDLRNAVLFHTFEQILSLYTSTRVNYDIIKTCEIEYFKKIKKISWQKKYFKVL